MQGMEWLWCWEQMSVVISLFSYLYDDYLLLFLLVFWLKFQMF